MPDDKDLGNILGSPINFDSDLSLSLLLLNLLVGFGISLLISRHYQRYGSTLANKDNLGAIFPAITLTIILIITVVKSSLALSLGLVGALSIVRFRTPIKEPEELAYLFLCIATGLGLGANQFAITVVSIPVILLFMALSKHRFHPSDARSIHININGTLAQKTPEAVNKVSDDIVDLVKKYTVASSLRRYDLKGDRFDYHFTAHIDNAKSLWALSSELEKIAPGADIVAMDNNEISVI